MKALFLSTFISRWASTTFAALSNTNFRRIWLAGIASNFGGVIQIMAASWLMVSLTSSPVLVAFVQTAAAAPVMLLAMIGGASADLFDKKRQIILSVLFCAVSAIVLCGLTAAGLVKPWSLLLLTAFIGAGVAFSGPAWQASVIELVSRKKLSSAASLNNLGFNVARSTGPVFGAELIALAGVSAAFLFNFLSYIVLLIAVVFWKREGVPQSLPRQALMRAVVDGVRFIGLSPPVRRGLIRSATFGFSASTLLALPPLMAIDIGGGPRTFGFLLSGFGGGAVIGALSAAWLRASVPNHRLLFIASIVVALALASLSVTTALPILVLLMTFAGAAWVLTISTINVAVQLACPRWVVARTIAASITTFQFGVAAGAACWGGVAELAGVPAALALSSAVLLAVTLINHRMPAQQPSEEDLEPRRLGPDLVMPDIDPRRGPVVVTFDYRVAQKNAEAFMAAMNDLSQTRRRDGARLWSLQQDIDDDTLWLEQFQSPTWGDYLHRINRRLAGDAQVYERVRALCEEEPFMHRRLIRPFGSKPYTSPPLPDRPTEANL